MKKLFFITLVFLLLQISSANSQVAAVDNVPPVIPTRIEIPTGPTLFGVFEGRTPCTGVAAQMKKTNTDCPKIKWRIILYCDAVTKEPTTCWVQGQPEGAKWKIIKGMPSNANAVIYQLDLVNAVTPVYLYKGDDNVLFFLDENKNFRVGNANFSFTLNRVQLTAMKN
jgi:hypothetical protein